MVYKYSYTVLLLSCAEQRTGVVLLRRALLRVQRAEVLEERYERAERLPLAHVPLHLRNWTNPHPRENTLSIASHRSPFCPMSIKENAWTDFGKQRITPGLYLL